MTKESKELIENWLNKEIQEQERIYGMLSTPGGSFGREVASRLTSLRTALSEFDKVVKDGIKITCESCGETISPEYLCTTCYNFEKPPF